MRSDDLNNRVHWTETLTFLTSKKDPFSLFNSNSLVWCCLYLVLPFFGIIRSHFLYVAAPSRLKTIFYNGFILTIILRLKNLKPARSFEPNVKSYTQSECQEHDDGITPWPFEFGHKLKIHTVYPSHHGWNTDNGRPSGKSFWNFILRNRYEW